MIINSPTAKAKNYYTYSASGVKLRTEQRYDPNLNVSPVNTTNPANDGLPDYMNRDYAGNIIYETAKNGSAITNRTRILVDSGYWENNVYYFYVTDHLGNNRVVVNQSGTVTQKNHYYPFGTAFADKYDNGTNQPYKYNGKELDGMHQLNLYDYSARYYESALGRFTSVDPHAEKYYSISPYVYCGNNPMRFIDPTGVDSIVYNQQGELIDRFRMKGDDRHYMQYEKGDQKVIEVLSQESIKGNPREKTPFNGILNKSFITTEQNKIIAKGVEKVNGYLDIVLQSKTGGSMDYKPLFKAGELININGVYMNNHEALNYMWGASMSEITYQDKADIRIDDALIGAQLFHMYDNVFGRSEGWKNQPNHNKAIKMGYNFNSASH